jgi:hypothetical protein
MIRLTYERYQEFGLGLEEVPGQMTEEGASWEAALFYEVSNELSRYNSAEQQSVVEGHGFSDDTSVGNSIRRLLGAYVSGSPARAKEIEAAQAQ